MKVLLRLIAAVTLATAIAGAQAITNAVPTITSFDVAYGGVGPNSQGTWTITGSAFATTTKSTRFVDSSGNDVFTGVSCSTTTTCTAGIRPGLKAPGTIGSITVFARTAGGTSAAGIPFLYYGAPTVSSLTPNTGAYNATTAYNINGAGFTSAATGFPGTTSIYLFTSISDRTSGCTTTSLCAASAPAVSADCCIIQGAKIVDIRTVGGSAAPYFLYGNAPATPTISSVSPNGGSQNGGNTITITGTNFIAGTNSSSGGGFGATLGTTFTFNTGFGGSAGTAVNCSSTTQCTVVAPAGQGSADIVVSTICGINSPASGCGGINARPSASIPSTRTGAYNYAGMKVNPPQGLFGGGPFLYTSENGRSATFTVALNTQPSASVHVALVAGMAGVATISPAGGLDFTSANWAAPQTVTVTGLDDAGGIGSAQYQISMTTTSADTVYNNLSQSSPSIVNVDNDSKQLIVAPQSIVTTRGGGTATFQVMLSKAPPSTITVNLASSDTTLGTVSASSLSFDTTSGGASSWNTPRTVTVTGQSDAQVGTPRTYSILVTTSSTDTGVGGYSDPTAFWPDVQVTNQDSPPSITAQPAGQSVNAGSLATFTASATGSPAPSVQWQVAANSTGAPFIDIAGAVTGTLSFATVAGDNGKLYRAVFTNAGGSTITATATLAILPTPPAITLQPQPTLTVFTGQAIFLSANASGSPAPAAQWQSSTNGGGSWSNIFGATSYNLSFGVARADNGKQYRCVFTNASGTANSNATALFVRLRVRSDVDNDRKFDLVVWRPSNGTWYWLTSSTLYNYANGGQAQWGSQANGDIPMSADMDGDGIMDLVVWRPTSGTFFWLTSSTGYNAGAAQGKQWGNNSLGDKPFIADIDGDGKGDLIVWRPSSGTWFYLLSSAGYSYAAQGQKQWGNSGLGDVPILGDFDGDGLVDLTVWRASTGTWYWLKSSTGYDVSLAGQAQWGNSGLGDIPLVADMDGDGLSDIVIWRPTDGTFYWLASGLAYNPAAPGVRQWGSSAQNDIPMLGDIDGDTLADLIVWRPASGTWFWLTSSSGYSLAGQASKQWGASTDQPIIK
jgi:hypothetical protein